MSEKYNDKKSQKKPRDGWEKEFEKMHQRGKDKLIIDNELDLDDWE